MKPRTSGAKGGDPSDQREREMDYEETDQELVISQIRDRHSYPSLYETSRLMADWGIYRGFGSDALKNMRDSQLFNTSEPLRLNPDGSNLVSILQQLGNEPRYRPIKARLYEVMEAVFPDFSELNTPITAGGRGALTYGSRYFDVGIPALSMSDGQLRFLGLVVLLLLPDPPALIAIDEPEIGLHPDMLSILVELLHEAAEKTQILITTHSPCLVDSMKPSEVIVVEHPDGKTTFERLSPEALDPWIERYSLGRLWTMGRFG